MHKEIAKQYSQKSGYKQYKLQTLQHGGCNHNQPLSLHYFHAELSHTDVVVCSYECNQ